MRSDVQGQLESGDSVQLLEALLALRERVVCGAEARLARFADAFPGGVVTPSAENLAHYLALRNEDVRPLQPLLLRHGLSSLGRSEAHLLAALDRVIEVLCALTDREPPPPAVRGPGFVMGAQALANHTLALFGRPPLHREVRIMVTLPRAAADDPQLIDTLVAAGMDCARINCAHDDRTTWLRMVQRVRTAEAKHGVRCRVLMDLPGHKVRTGPLAERLPVVRLRPERNVYGQVIAPALVELVASTAAGLDDNELPEAPNRHTGTSIRLQLPEAVLTVLHAGDRLRFLDARGKQRQIRIERPRPSGGFIGQSDQSAYVTPHTSFVAERRDHQRGGWRMVAEKFLAANFAIQPVEIRLYEGDQLLLMRSPGCGEPEQRDQRGALVSPARIACSHPQVISRLLPGHEVWIDDGKLGGVIERVDENGALLTIRYSRPSGVRLQADKGLNFPGVDLGLPPLSRSDLADLDFVIEHADLIGYSFVESRADMEALSQALSERGATDMGIIAKIETRRAVENLSEIILSTIGRHRLGVMIARGDLAVEIGGERLAEIQEELLWLCEAAHVPVIWATQVLETLAKKGVVSRPELTDAAMAGRAECVMLNKGPYIERAVRTLDGILLRMQEHQRKKTPRLRALRLARSDDVAA